ncbi:MAG: FtsW/RodA/SpoVE family cell cycle protein [Myxococcota bacterium]
MIGIIAEILLTILVVIGIVFWGVDASVSGALAAAAEQGGELERTAAAVNDAASRSRWMYLAGIAVMMAGRVLGEGLSRLRGSGSIQAPLLLPAVALMTGLGVMLQWGYSDPLHASAAFYYGPAFAPGVLYGGIVAGLMMAVPWSPGLVAARGRWLIGGGALLVMLLLAVLGDAPGSSGAKINLFGVQPIEAVKLAFVVFLAGSLGRNVAQLRYQRDRVGWLHWPRLPLLLPALALTGGLFLLMFAVRDLGPTLILSAVLIAFYYAVVRSWLEVSIISAAVFVGGLLVVFLPLPFLPDNVAVRADMLRDPWLNGHIGGDQLASGLWAMAAGGFDGQGWGKGAFGMLPAGHTDLILAHLTEVSGLFGLGLYSVVLLGLIAQAFWIAWRNRTPERTLLAFGVGTLLLAQWGVIFAGTVGVIPLTGVVVPFLSYGKTSMILFMAAVGLLGRLAAGGRIKAEMDELTQLRGGIMALVVVSVAVFGTLGAVATARVAVAGPNTTARGVLTVGWDDTVFFRYDPRIRAIARKIPRGEIRDRDGKILAGNDADLNRIYPLGDAMGTLLGAANQGISLPDWAAEGTFDARLRGLDDVEEPLAVFIEQRKDTAKKRRRDRVLFTVRATQMRDVDLKRARRMRTDKSSTILFTRLKQIDYRPLVPILHRSGKARTRAIAKKTAEIDQRSVTLSIDARLQQAAAAAAKTHGSANGKAAAAVVIDVDTGQVLARAQWPDYDPGDPKPWKSRLLRTDMTFMGSYGPWKDKTGVAGLYQSGSIFKVATALAAVREGVGFDGQACRLDAGQTFDCFNGRECRGNRPCVTMPHWSKPIHDGHRTPDGDDVDLIKALEISCNVYFAQLGIALGPQPLADLVADGMEVDYGDVFSPGAPGSRQLASTAYGQGAARMHPLQAARMVAAVGAGGVYRKCPANMRLSADCASRILAQPGQVEPILSGMKKVVDQGTARWLKVPDGVRAYGKTGTATDPGRSDETPFGIAKGSVQNPHSWFVALAEPEGVPECKGRARGRIAIAAVVPRGGSGAGAARSITQDILTEAHSLGYFSR